MDWHATTFRQTVNGECDRDTCAILLHRARELVALFDEAISVIDDPFENCSAVIIKNGAIVSTKRKP